MPLTIEEQNNPGALRIPGSKQFQTFASNEEGIRAQEDLLHRRYLKKGLRTPKDIIETYAPRKSKGGDNTDEQVNNYIGYVSERLGIKPTDAISPNAVPQLAAAIREFETGKKKPVSGKYYARSGEASRFTGDVLSAIDAGPKDYSVGEPSQGEVANVQKGGNFPIANPATADTTAIKVGIDKTIDSAQRYTTFLENAIEPIRKNAEAVVQEKKSIAQTKQNIADDFATRERDLELKIAPLQAQREKLANRLNELESLSPLDRRFKSAFSSDWDPRIIRGRMERVDAQIEAYSKTYAELNTLRSGVAALMVDADNADIDVIEAQARGILAESNMLGQVSSAVSTNLDRQLLPFDVQAKILSLQEVAKKKILGNLSLEMVTKAYNDALASPDGTTTIDGVKLSVGELQDASRVAQSQDISFRSLKNAYSLQDIETANMIESQLIDHMTPEQINEALKNNGMWNGQQLSITKLTQAAGNSEAIRAKQVSDIVKGTAVGQAADFLKSLGQFMQDSSTRVKEMFGNEPGELVTVSNSINAEIGQWRKGFENAQAQGIAQDYIAQTMPQIASMRDRFDKSITAVAEKWGGGKKELSAVAENYLRGNPISGDAALNGLVIIARSGMPAGAKLSGPAQQALNAARAEVLAWDAGPDAKAGDSIEKLLAGGNAKKKEDLLRKVQTAVSAVYADGITNELLNQIPDLAKAANHPFSQVSKDQFTRAVRHGDHEGYERVGRDLGLDAVQTQRMLAEGVGGNTWAVVKKAKGYDDAQFDDVLQRVQASQMTGLLQALDAQHKGSAEAFINFMQSPKVANQVDALVNGYGRSSFGAYLVSSSSGGGYREQWQAYTEGLAASYTALTSTELRQKIREQRSLLGDPLKRFGAVLGAAGLTKEESQILIQATAPLAGLSNRPDYQYLSDKGMFLVRDVENAGNFDRISNVIQSHKFEDPAVERIRQKAAKRWDEMNSVLDAVNESLR